MATMICQFQADCKAMYVFAFTNPLNRAPLTSSAGTGPSRLDGWKCDSKPHGATIMLPGDTLNGLSYVSLSHDSCGLMLTTPQAQNHEYAADPIKFVARVRPPPIAPPPIPTPSPATIGPSSVPAHIAQPQSASSPIPLATAGFLGNRPEPPALNVNVNVNNDMVAAAAAASATQGAFPEGLFTEGLDLSSIGMDELNALISGTGAEFGAAGGQQQPQQQEQDFSQLGMNAAMNAGGADNNEPASAMTPNTKNIFDTLNGQNQLPPSQNQNQIQQQSQQQTQRQPQQQQQPQ